MRVLQFAPRLCWPLDTGAKLRNYHLARVLAGSASVSLLTFAESSQDQAELANVYEKVVTIPRDQGYSMGKLLRGAVGRTPLPLLNYTSEEMKQALAQTLIENDFNIIQIESIHLMNYLPVIRAARNRPLVICDWHNVESDLMRQYAEREPNVARRTYARRTARLMIEAEKRALKEFDAHLTVSDQDRGRLSSVNAGARIFVIENGVDAFHYTNQHSDKADRIVFVGSMDYHANIDGATNFARNVWPMIQQKHSNLRFTIVGRNPPSEVTELSSIAGIEVTGSVADVRTYYREALAAVVPLNVGGGSRLKILEAMAAGVPVVSTRLGAEGLDVSDGENILLAESSAQLANGILRVIEAADLCARLVTGGHALVRARYDWSMLGVKLLDQYQTLLAGETRLTG
jgi:sugar transferase (PEP-CTERM/EpsH1 system associated)